jgi:hypothetical protein
VDTDAEAYRKRLDNKAVRKSLKLPSWLSERAEEEGINLSDFLPKALKEELQIR